jgi:nucleoside phosphorylase
MTAAQRTAVIITALPEERDAVLEHLRDVTEEPELRGSIYRRGIFDERCDPCNVALAEIGAGNEGAAAEAERVIAHYSPQVALFVGVAGGIKDVKHGDVIVSSKIYGYESGKDQRKGFKPRPSVHLPSYGLEQRARYEAGEPEWRQRIKECNTWQQLAPVVKVGPIAAGEKVLSSNRTQIYKFIREHYGDALAVEMEGHGFLLGVHRNHPTLGIVVRSISDCISDKSEASDVTWQPIAARHAAAFAFQMLAKLSLTEGERASRSRSNSAPEPPTESRIQAELEVTYDGFSDDGKCPRITFSVNNKTKDLVILTDVRARIVDFREVTFFLGLGADSSIPRTQLVLNFGRVSAKVTDSVMQQGSGPPRYRPISLVDPDRVVHIRPGSAESYSLSVSGTTDYRGLGHVCLLMIEVVISSNDDGASDRIFVGEILLGNRGADDRHRQ